MISRPSLAIQSSLNGLTRTHKLPPSLLSDILPHPSSSLLPSLFLYIRDYTAPRSFAAPQETHIIPGTSRGTLELGSLGRYR